MVRGEVEGKCVEVGEVEMVRWRRRWWKKMEEWRRLENLVEGKGRIEKGKKKRK